MSTQTTPARQNGFPAGVDPLSPTRASEPSARRLQRGSSSKAPFSPSKPSTYRRTSGQTVTTSRKPSQTTTSGTSTPQWNRRGGRSSIGVNGKVSSIEEEVGGRDWARMDADEVFRKLPVNEVKRVELKMRTEAFNKQSDLRSMVGTRYRDLLTSATQITTLRESSIHLSESLKSISKACKDPVDAGSSGKSDVGNQSDGEEVVGLLPTAAHMKLLLDAPEALYAHLSRHAFLNAAFLWLVTRVVKENLSKLSDEAQTAYAPLLQKQWETLQPFRAQITQRATASLRSRAKMDPKTCAETLLAIILLDNLPVSDALALLFAQRLRALRDILSLPPTSPQTSKSPLLNLTLPPPKARSRAGSRSSARSSSPPPVPPTRSSEEIGKVLTEAVQSMLETVSLVHAVFEKASNGTESLLDGMIRLIQIGEPLPPPTLPLSSNATMRQRRASRLASISIPLPTINPNSASPPVSSFRVLHDLPSRDILLRHLPPTITGFTPFISPSSAPPLEAKLGEWRKEAIELLRGSVPSSIRLILSAAEVWRLRSRTNDLLGEGAFEGEIRKALQGEWEKRAKAIWEDKLDRLIRKADQSLRDAVGQLLADGDDFYVNPTGFTFSEPSFPTMSTTLAGSTASLDSFLVAVRKRRSGRTPLLDSILTSLEDQAKTLREDLTDLPAPLRAEYGRRVETTIRELATHLRAQLDEAQNRPEESWQKISAELLVGRMALYLAKSSGCLRDLAGESSIDAAPTIAALSSVHSSSVTNWHAKAINEALQVLRLSFDPLIGPKEIASSWQGPYPTQPSTQVMNSLFSLVQATRRLGIPPGMEGDVISSMTRDFVTSAGDLGQWKGMKEEAAAQAAFDLAFLHLISNGSGAEDPVVKDLLAEMPSTIPPDFASKLAALLIDHLRRTQVLLAPLINHLDPGIISANVTLAETKNGLLKYGPPKSAAPGVTTEFKSPIALAKPGQRFALLSIAS